MSKKCNNPKCPKHHISVKDGKYCPVCGGLCVPLPIFPFYIYIPIRGAVAIAASLFLSAMIIFWFVPRAKAKQAMIDSMPQPWVSVYVTMKGSTSECSNQVVLYRMLASSDPVPYLTPEQCSILMRLTESSKTENMLAELFSRMKSKKHEKR